MIRRSDHPFLAWCIEHLVVLYIALIVTAILPVVILELAR